MTDLLLYGGIAVVGASLAIGIVVVANLWASKRRLNLKMDSEYGKRQ